MDVALFFGGGRLPHRKVVCILDIFNRINHFEREYLTLWPLRPLAPRATFWPLRHFLAIAPSTWQFLRQNAYD